MSGTRTPVYTMRVDEVSSTVTYIGRAIAGSSESDAVWLIKKMEQVGTVLSIKTVDGTSASNAAWAQRTGYTYS